MRNYAMPERDEIETWTLAIAEALFEDGIDAQPHLYRKLSLIQVRLGCSNFSVSVVLKTEQVMVRPADVPPHYVDDKRRAIFNLADPGLFKEIALYIKNYHPPESETVFVESVSKRLDQAHKKW